MSGNLIHAQRVGLNNDQYVHIAQYDDRLEVITDYDANRKKLSKAMFGEQASPIPIRMDSYTLKKLLNMKGLLHELRVCKL